MSAGELVTKDPLRDIDQRAREFFEPKLIALGLGIEDIRKQSLSELEESLERIDDASRHPDQFGVLRLTVTARAAVVVVQSDASSVVEVGILPTLLERKRLIIDRIKVLKPQDQLASLRDQIAKSVDDLTVRDKLFSILDHQEVEEKEFVQRIEAESQDLGVALQGERDALQSSIVVAKLEVKLEALEASFRTRSDGFDKTLGKLEDKSVTKFDVVTIVFLILAALGGLVGAISAIAKWVI
ncbi:hypothetical protein ABZ399_31455 [Micromonospora aurantiaca]|uniref:hypothetical protein n=1 Tax=Micromonospora aurantiaca (nom. illeg.) TaxID=47850 RepID=UPI0033E8DE59